MAETMPFLARRAALGLADFAVTMPLVRWTWTGLANEEVVGGLAEFRPTDRESVLEMMAGRYLLASKLIDTHGASPFELDVDHADWLDDLHTFSWLRHFRDARNEDERHFARTLTLDWISREGSFSRDIWAPAMTARRVLNWLKHYNLIVDGASLEETATISRSLGTQIQSLRLRGNFAGDPVDAMLSAIALCGVALSDEKRFGEIPARVRHVHRLIERQYDPSGLHRTRSAKIQLLIMIELLTLKQALKRYNDRYATEFDAELESMHRGLDAVSLGTGEPAYFHGTGQMPHDLIVAVQAQDPSRMRETGTAGGFGRLVAGKSIVVADSGLVPPPDYARHAHSSALAFEFSHGRELIVCNCGPAPAGVDDYEGDVARRFREGIAHSCPTINGVSAEPIPHGGPLAGRLTLRGKPAELTADPADDTVVMTCHGYAGRFGVAIERRLTLLADGKSLVGQDKFVRAGRPHGTCHIRFHLAPGAEPQISGDMVRLRLQSGAYWNFMWDGAQLGIEDSVRQSAHFGYHKTRQLVLQLPVAGAGEVSWIFTLDEE